MKRLLIILMCAIMLTGCGQKAVNTPRETKEAVNDRLETLKQAYKDAGFTVGENETVAFDMLKAKNGIKFKVDGELIEIYEFDTKNDEAKKVIEQAEKGTVDLSGFKIPVKYKDGLMLMRHDEHSKKDKVIEIFEK